MSESVITNRKDIKPFHLVLINLFLYAILSPFKLELVWIYPIFAVTSFGLCVMIHPKDNTATSAKIVMYLINTAMVFTSTIGSAQFSKQTTSAVASWFNQEKIEKVYVSHDSVIKNPIFFAQIQTTQNIVKSKEDVEKYAEIMKFLKKHPEYIGKKIAPQKPNEEFIPELKAQDENKSPIDNKE